MCAFHAWDNKYASITDYASSDDEIPMTSKSFIEENFSLGQTITFIENWLQCFEVNYENRITSHRRKKSELFKTIPK